MVSWRIAGAIAALHVAAAFRPRAFHGGLRRIADDLEDGGLAGTGADRDDFGGDLEDLLRAADPELAARRPSGQQAPDAAWDPAYDLVFESEEGPKEQYQELLNRLVSPNENGELESDEERLKRRIDDMQPPSQVTCPKCGSFCTQEELDRHQTCSFCFVQELTIPAAAVRVPGGTAPRS